MTNSASSDKPKEPADFFETEQPNRVDVLRARLQASLKPGDNSRPTWFDPFGTVQWNIVQSRRPPPYDVIDTPLGKVRIAGGYWPS
jgi:hypothetical protein